MPTKKVAKKTARKVLAHKALKVRFDDESGVLREVAWYLGIPAYSLRLRRGSTPCGHGDAYEVTIGAEGRTGKSWYVMANEEEFETAAINGVEGDLREEPGNFERNFIEGHINIGRLRKALHTDVFDQHYDRLTDEAKKHPMAFLKNNNLDIPEPSDSMVRQWAKVEGKTADDITDFRRQDEESQWADLGDDPDVPLSVVEEATENATASDLTDPVDYLIDIYGQEEGVAQAVKIGGIDIEQAAIEAVKVDGAAHFMNTYDGNYETTKPSGFVVWRHN